MLLSYVEAYNYRACCIHANSTLQEAVGGREGHKTIGKKLGKMWSKFRQRGKSMSIEVGSPTANSKGSKSPPPQLSLDGSDDDDEDEEVEME